MTSVRPPLSIDGALARIAGQMPGSWHEMATIVGRADSTVRNWGNPNTSESIPIDSAIQLDIAYQAAGGIGAPIYETYSLQLETALAERFSCAIALARKTMTAIREGGEAHEALVAATLPGASDRDRAEAAREVEEGIAALKECLPFLVNRIPAASAQPP